MEWVKADNGRGAARDNTDTITIDMKDGYADHDTQLSFVQK